MVQEIESIDAGAFVAVLLPTVSELVRVRQATLAECARTRHEFQVASQSMRSTIALAESRLQAPNRDFFAVAAHVRTLLER